MESKKVFISVGMSGRLETDVRNDIQRATDIIKDMLKTENIEIIHNYDCEEPPVEYKSNTWYLGNAIIKMGICDVIFFTKGYHKHKGCLIEEEVAMKYNMYRLYE